MNLRGVKNVIAFFPIWCIDTVLSMFPRSWAIRFGEYLGRFLSLFFGGRRELMMRNMRFALPERTDKERLKIISGVWENIGRVACEFIKLSEITKENFRDFFEVEGEDLVAKAKAKGKGIIFVGFHFANWEMSGVGGNYIHGHMVAVARPIKNPLVETWVRKKRGGGGMDVILHRDAVRGCLKALKKNDAVGILVDQNLYQGGVFVNFFGRPAATTPLPALLHSRTESPVLLLYCKRGEGKKIKLIFEEPPPFPSSDDENALTTITQILSSRIEAIIRSEPSSWFWVHNRWKRQPLPSEMATS